MNMKILKHTLAEGLRERCDTLQVDYDQRIEQIAKELESVKEAIEFAAVVLAGGSVDLKYSPQAHLLKEAALIFQKKNDMEFLALSYKGQPNDELVMSIADFKRVLGY